MGTVIFFLVPTRRRGNPDPTRPRRGGAGAAPLGSHAGAWEPEKSGVALGSRRELPRPAQPENLMAFLLRCGITQNQTTGINF
jgi:hypothetical protein